MAKKRRSKTKKQTNKTRVQSDDEAAKTLDELEGMVSPLPERKSGADRVNERAEELNDASQQRPEAYGPAGKATGGNTGATEAILPGSDGHKKVAEEFMRKKAEAENGGTEPVAATPSGPPRGKKTSNRIQRQRVEKRPNPPPEKDSAERQPKSEDTPPRPRPKTLTGGVALPDAKKAGRRLRGS